MHFLLSIFFMMPAMLAGASSVESIKLKTPRGAELEIAIHIPDSTSKTPAVIIAPGQGYHMGLPLTEGLARKIADAGFAAIRFDWHYYREGEPPSGDLSNETEDLATVIAFAKNHSKIDKNKLILAGKSLGTLVSYREFASDAEVKALILMTPLCTARWDDQGHELPKPVPVGFENYPSLLQAKRPVVIVLGNNDPNCALPMLYDFLKDSSGNIATVVVGRSQLKCGSME